MGRKSEKEEGRSGCERFKMTLRKSLNSEFGNTEGVEKKENFREEEEDFPALLYVTDSKAVS